MRRIVFLTSHCLLAVGAVLFVMRGAAADTASFDDLTLDLESYWNGSDGSTGFISGDNWFTNAYNPAWGSWDGFAYSNKTDTASTGMAGQYTAYSGNGMGGGVNGSANYGIGYVGYVTPPQTYNGIVSGECAQAVPGAYFTNNAYAYDSMLNGDAYAKQFGGTTGNDEDWFKLTVQGLNDSYVPAGGTVEFYLADYRFTDNSQDYIVTDWTYVDLTSLGTVYGLQFTLTSSDVGTYGMNTPAYFAIDNLGAVPEPATLAMLLVCGLTVGTLSLFRKRKFAN